MMSNNRTVVMASRTVIIDIQGFQLDQLFIPKEMTAVDLNTGLRMSHHVFKEPYPFDELSEKHKNNVRWLTDHYHGLSWAGVGHTHLGDMRDVIDEITFDADRVLCKGTVKKMFLQKYVRCEVVDLDAEVPSLRRLTNKATCSSHNFENCHCSMTNVFYIYNYLRFIQI